MTQITDEMKVAAVKAYTEVDGKCRPAAMQKALEAALPFLPIAVEGKVDPEAHKRGLRAAVEIYLSPHSINLWNDAAIEDMEACMENAIATYHKVAAPSSPGKEGGQEVDGKRVERWRRASIALGSWMAAALDNDEVCEAMKADIREWFSASEPFEGMADDGPLTISYPVHEIAHNLLLAHTGSEGGSPTVNWYGLRSEIADAIAAALDKQRRLDTQPASTALVEALEVAADQILNMYRTWVVDDATAMPTENSMSGRAYAKAMAALASAQSTEEPRQ